MRLPKELTTVTPLSKAVALLMFISLPIITFFFGMSYQSVITKFPPPTREPVGCTMEAKICPDGTAVGRVGPNCEFEKCPSTDNSTTQAFCGGIAGKKCPSGYYCKYEGTYPDAGGTCLKDETAPSFICPESGWINCMPILTDESKKNCSKEAVVWYKANCPNFKGVAQ